MASDLDEAYTELGDMCADLFEAMGVDAPSRADFDALMGPLLRQAKTDGDEEPPEQLSSAASFDPDADFVIDRGLAGNRAFTDELSRELRQRLEAKKGQGPRSAN